MEGTSQDGYIIQIQIEYLHHKIAIYKPKIKIPKSGKGKDDAAPHVHE